MHITSVTPAKLLTGQSKEITLTGYGFVAPFTVVVFGIFLPAFFVTPTLAKFILPYIPEGTYDINVIGGDGATWIQRQAIMITDPPGTYPPLGSVERPLVMPPIVIDSECTATINPAAAYRDASSGATVSYNVSTGVVTATKSIDTSVEGNSVPRNYSTVTPTDGVVLTTPWGTFSNE